MNPIGMHYGFWSHNWDEIAYIPLMEKLAWLGFDICEVASAEWGYYDDARLRELKACADHNGLGITYSIGLEAKYDLASDDPAVRENGIRHVTRILESMPKVGATILNGVSYAGWQALPDHGITLDEKRRKEELALESMSRLMKVAENCGVLYCCEVVNRFEQYLLNTAKEGVFIAFLPPVHKANACDASPAVHVIGNGIPVAVHNSRDLPSGIILILLKGTLMVPRTPDILDLSIQFVGKFCPVSKRILLDDRLIPQVVGKLLYHFS